MPFDECFIYNNGTTYLSVKDGKVILSAAESEWKEGLKYLSKLYSEGLIDKGAFTQNGDAVSDSGTKRTMWSAPLVMR